MCLTNSNAGVMSNPAGRIRIVVLDVDLAYPFLCETEEGAQAFKEAIERMGHEARILRKAS